MSGSLGQQRRAVEQLLPILSTLQRLGDAFTGAGFELSLVGGPVRDALLGRLTADTDLDFATSARPEEAKALLASLSGKVWDVGIDFGTVGATVDGRVCEITTYRREEYELDSRKPAVSFGASLREDLSRRDFTVNALALRLPAMALVDEFGGLDDLAAGVLRTPRRAAESFIDDPLRMLRAARFRSQLGMQPTADVFAAMRSEADRLRIVSAERIRDELVKLLLGHQPRAGLDLLVDTGLAQIVLPELPLLRLERDEHHRHKDVYDHSLTVLEQAMDLEMGHSPASRPDLILRLAALLHDIGKPKTRKFEGDGRVSFHHHEMVGARLTRKRLQALRFSNEVVDDVSRLVELHLRFHGYASGEWTDSAVRRYVRDAGDLLPRLHKLTRADCTTRNRQRAARLQRDYDHLEHRIAELAEQEEINAIRPDLDGSAIMAILGIAPGPQVGEAYRFLMELRLDRGPLGPEEAERALRDWWGSRGSATENLDHRQESERK